MIHVTLAILTKAIVTRHDGWGGLRADKHYGDQLVDEENLMGILIA